MLIGICGGICAGKKTVAQYLVDHHGFKHLHLEPPSSAPSIHIFATAQALLDYVTSRWQDRWVLTHVHSEAVLDLLSRRPFFLLISENALLEAGRERIRDGAVLYCDTCPCLTCSIKVCQVGIREVVYAQGYSMDIETAAVFREAGVKLRQFVPPPNGLIQLENVDKLDLY
ncbi:3-isopropylmalate dehydrogenase [Verticillium dahliae VDG2]|nr:3-isopropylmalate dehydrogenase [Verticillium dahliae VDG2]